MIIWRGLQPGVMAQLIVGLAQARQTARADAKGAQPAPPSAPPKK